MDFERKGFSIRPPLYIYKKIMTDGVLTKAIEWKPIYSYFICPNFFQPRHATSLSWFNVQGWCPSLALWPRQPTDVLVPMCDLRRFTLLVYPKLEVLRHVSTIAILCWFAYKPNVWLVIVSSLCYSVCSGSAVSSSILSVGMIFM